MERQRDERLKAARFVLKFAKPDQVVDAVLRLFDVAVEHRRVGVQAELVGGAVDVEPGSVDALRRRSSRAPRDGRSPRRRREGCPAPLRSNAPALRESSIRAILVNHSISTPVYALT